MVILLVKFLPPSWHIAAVAAVELRRNVIMTAGALTAIVVFNIHCFAPLLLMPIALTENSKPTKLRNGHRVSVLDYVH
jgi:hypothetical protein